MNARTIFVNTALMLVVLVASGFSCHDPLKPEPRQKVGLVNAKRFTVCTVKIDDQEVANTLDADEERIVRQRYFNGTKHTVEAWARDPSVYHGTATFIVPSDERYTCAGDHVSVLLTFGGGVKDAASPITFTSQPSQISRGASGDTIRVNL